MSIQALGSRAIIGTYYRTLSVATGQGWIGALSNYFTSDQDSETYKWLGMSPALREWIGGREAKGFRDQGITLVNVHYEATLEVFLRDLRRDKTSQTLTRVREMARRTASHWASLLTTLIISGEATTCYDGQYFFDTDHSEGDSGTQSNDISADISTYPVATGGTTTAPSVGEMQFAIVAGIQQLMGFVDDVGEPMNEDAMSFLVMVPLSFMQPALNAITTPAQVAETQTALVGLRSAGVNIQVVANARLSSWTTKFAVHRVDNEVKPYIRQEEVGVQMKAKAEGSDFEFDNDAHQYGVDTWRTVGFGQWQNACLVTLI